MGNTNRNSRLSHNSEAVVPRRRRKLITLLQTNLTTKKSLNQNVCPIIENVL